MKALVVLAFTFAAGITAHAADTYPGIVSDKGLDHVCSFANQTANTLVLKYVNFTVQDISGSNNPRDIQADFNQSIAPGEVAEATMPTQAVEVDVLGCAFIGE